jgi:hypothetical protein
MVDDSLELGATEIAVDKLHHLHLEQSAQILGICIHLFMMAQIYQYKEIEHK